MLRSHESAVRAFIKFINQTQKVVEVHWINYNGESIHYISLEPGGTGEVNTYCTHPWIFMCPRTKQRLHVNNSHVLYPEAWFKYMIKAENGTVSVGRQEAFIRLPLNSLRERCHWEIISCIQSKDDIDRLELPRTVKAELLEFYEMYV